MTVRLDLERPYGRITKGVTLAACVFLMLPVAFIILFSFNDAVYFRWPPQHFSIRWYANFFASDRFMQAAKNSLIIAGVVTPSCLLVGIPTALIIVRGRFPGRNIVAAILLSPLIVPGVVTGISLLVLFAQTQLELGITKLIIGMFIFGLPFAVRAIAANLVGLDHRIEEAARNLGASARGAFIHVTLPQLKPGLIAGGVFVFVEAIDNFSISVFLVGSRTTTLPVEAYSYIRDFDDPTVAAMATLLVLLSCVLVFAIERVMGLERMIRLQ